MKFLAIFLLFSNAFGCEEPCEGKVDFKKVRAYLTQNMPLNFGLEESSLALVGEHGVHLDKEELRGYGFFPKTKMAGIYRLDCINQNDSSLEQVEMVQILPGMNDDLSIKVREYFLWVKQYPEILNLWVSKSTLLGLSKNYDHWLVLVNLPGDKGTPSWWKFVEFRSKKGSNHLEEWAGAFAHPVIPLPPQAF
jgi:hypothetical protein